MGSRYIVKRYREHEAAPSLSLGYPGETPERALQLHVLQYGVHPNARYEVCYPGERHGCFLKPRNRY